MALLFLMKQAIRFNFIDRKELSTNYPDSARISRFSESQALGNAFGKVPCQTIIGVVSLGKFFGAKSSFCLKGLSGEIWRIPDILVAFLNP
jgi:hypothetical protein